MGTSEHNGAIWDTKPYHKSINMIMESNYCRNDTKTLNIRWDTRRVGSDVLLPEIHLVSITINPISYVVCNNVLQLGVTIKLDCLSAIKNYKNYKVYVHTYSKFSSLVCAQENQGWGVKGIEKWIGDCNSIKKIVFNHALLFVSTLLE